MKYRVTVSRKPKQVRTQNDEIQKVNQLQPHISTQTDHTVCH